MPAVPAVAKHPRVMLPLVAALFVLTLTACGGTSDEDQIKTTVSDYLKSTVSGDGNGACRQMTENGRRAAIATANAALGDGSSTDCASAVHDVYMANINAGTDLPLLTEIDKQFMDSAQVNVDGSTATVTLSGDGATEPTLRKVAGDWKIDDLGNGTS